MNACATASTQTAPVDAVSVAADVPARTARHRPSSPSPSPSPARRDIRHQAARVVATTRRHWLDAVP